VSWTRCPSFLMERIPVCTPPSIAGKPLCLTDLYQISRCALSPEEHRSWQLSAGTYHGCIVKCDSTMNLNASWTLDNYISQWSETCVPPLEQEVSPTN
jgi:hypothetical protein